MSDDVVTDDERLRSLCAQLSPARWIALDTEFMRTRTYRARLCLVQLATTEQVACVDPLALADLTPLIELLHTPTILKVMHAGRQDLEVFVDLGRPPPQPVFDTQIAAALVGYDDQIGYGGLVEAVTGRRLAKGEARTDWAARPLSAAQILYAEDDVRYLGDVYRELAARLKELGRESWLTEECAALTDPALYRSDPGQAWRRLGAGAMLPPGAQTLLAALAQWRERMAQLRDLPRGWVVPDTMLVELARQAPQTPAALSGIPEERPGVLRRDGVALLEVIVQARQAPLRQLWEPLSRLDLRQTILLKRLSALVQQRARTAQLSSTLVAPRRELVRLVRGDPESALLRGWRRTFIGDELLTLCQHDGGA